MALSLIDIYNERIKRMRETIDEALAEEGEGCAWWLDNMDSKLQKLVAERDSILIELEKLNEN